MNKYNILKSNSAYFIYLAFSAIFYQILISVFSFFHFQLGHRVGVIEDWIYDQGWILIVLSKFFSFYIFYKIYTLDFSFDFLFKKLWKRPSASFVISLCFLWIMQFVVWGGPSNLSFMSSNIVIDSIFGQFAFYFFDLFILQLIIMKHPIYERASIRFIRSLGFSSLFILSFNWFYPFSLFDHSFPVLFWSFINFLFLCSCSVSEGKSYSNGLVWIVFYIIPTGLLYWLDPIYGKISVNAISNLYSFPVFYLLCWIYIKLSSSSEEQSWLRDSVSDRV